MNAPPNSVTHLLSKASGGDASARDTAFGLVYEELKRVAHHQLAGNRALTLNTTALVHESFVRLAAAHCPIEDRRHFFALAARAMRFVLVDHARQRGAQKRDGGIKVTLDTQTPQSEQLATDVLALDAALDHLNQLDARLAQVVEWRYFGGMTEPEIALELGVTERTVQRDWRKARAFLHRELAQSA